MSRIVVALDASPHSQAALDAAARLAARMHAELIGVYVEDIDLLHLSGLPFARELSAFSQSARAVDTPSMERTLRAEASRIRKRLEHAAGQAMIRWSFHVSRGAVARELLSATHADDVLIVGKASSSRARRLRTGRTTRTVVLQSRCSVVVIHQGADLKGSTLVVFDGSESTLRALRQAGMLASDNHREVVVLLQAQDTERAEALRDQARTVAEQSGFSARYIRSTHADAPAIVAAVQREGCSTLLLTADSPLAARNVLPDLLDEIDCAVMVVR